MDASPASRNMRVAAGSGLLTGRAQLGDEVVGVAAVVGLAELDRASVAQEAEALDQQPGIALARVQQPRLLGGEQQRAQALQRAHRAVAGALQRFIQGDSDRFERGQRSARDGRVLEAHRRVVGVAQAVEAVDRRAGRKRSVSASSGVTWPAERFSQTLRGVRPRARMSSENEVSFAKFFSTRAETKLPEPCRRTSRPSSTRPSIALRTVMRETARSVAIWRSAGRASSGARSVVLDRLPQRALQLLVQRLAPLGVQRPEDFGQGSS